MKAKTNVITKDDFQEGNAPLCDKDIVASTCYLLSGDHETRHTGSNQLQKILAAKDESITEAWSVLKLQDAQVTCDELCSKVVDYLKERGNCPPQSNLGCYRGADGDTVCDLDLSTKAVTKAADFTGNLPDLHDKKLVEKAGTHIPPEVQALDAKPLDYSTLLCLFSALQTCSTSIPEIVMLMKSTTWTERQA